MATGITKGERRSKKAISAANPYGDELPLPPSDTDVCLSYPNKADETQIKEIRLREFVIVKDGLAKPTSEIPKNSFVLDDNFYTLNALVAQGLKADLFYLDPPYGTGFDFQSRSLEHAYEDNMGAATYVEFIRRRLILMRECLSEDGSIYVHIGHQMVAQLKLIMDEVFGSRNFRNLITRRKCSSKNYTSRTYANTNDFILFYSKGRNYKWTKPGLDPEQAWIEKEYPKIDALGRRYKLVPIHAPGTRNGETGKAWREMLPPPGKHWQYVPSKLEELDRAGDIHWSKNGNPRRKVYWSDARKAPVTDYWSGFRDAHHQSVRITGYPTEKNIDMLKLIINASSEADDLVVDPFCGSGTTMQAARELGRDFIGIDASFVAAKTTLNRMRHGATPMGDYVNRPIQHTLELGANPINGLSNCTFVTEKTLFDRQADEILEFSDI